MKVFVGLLENYFKVTFYLSTSKDSEVLRNTEAGSPTCKKYKENKSLCKSMTTNNVRDLLCK